VAIQANLRVRYRLVCVALAAMFALPMLVAEGSHALAYHHAGFGLHVDVQRVRDYPRTAYEGYVVDYTMLVTNLTPLPIPVRRCMVADHTGVRFPDFAYRVQRSSDGRKSWREVETSQTCAGPDRLEWTVLWPGSRIRWASERIHHCSPGDWFRFTAVAIYSGRPHDSISLRGTQDVQFCAESR
jgi:hypothetical protein